MNSAPNNPKLRRIILTASIATIAATGAWYGVGLKTDQERKKEIATIGQSTAAERIATLEAAKSDLMARKLGLERKIGELERRRSGIGREEQVGRERR